VSFCLAGLCSAQEDNVFFDETDLLIDTNAEDESLQEKAAQAAEATQRRHQELLQQRQQQQQRQQVAEQHAKAEEAYRNAVSEFEKLVKQHDSQSDPQRAMLEQQMKQLEMQRAALAQQMAQLQSPEMMMRQLRGLEQQNAPMPKDGKFSVFHLRYSKAPEAARVLSHVLSGVGMRMAVDERTNSLLVFSDTDTIQIVQSLLQKLDEPAGNTVENAQPGETLQLRVVWLLDIDEGMEPNDKLVSPEVVEALHELGFSNPKVVCQQVTTLTLSDDAGRRGQFNFAVPVLIKSSPWQFYGSGQIEAMADDRSNLKFDLSFRPTNSGGGGGGRGRSTGQDGQLGGSIFTPLGHYTVMGTSTFVVSRNIPVPVPEGSFEEVSNQHLSAFVVYLDRAREFPAPQAPSNNRTDVRR
jgi:hypothetical protein